MGSNQYYDDGEDEAVEAQNRIDQILSGGGQNAQQPVQPAADNYDDPLGGGPRVELRSRAARSALGLDQQETNQPRQRQRQQQGGRAPAPKAQQAIMVIGGILALGIIVIVVIFLIASATKPGAAPISLPFISTATSTPTNTPTPTTTPTPTPTVPPLQLPNLTCLVQSTVGCLDYCQNVDNLKECDAARDTVETQGADFTAFLKCLEPVAGPNSGNPQTCLEDAYRAKHP